jgi:hypothetical protein
MLRRHAVEPRSITVDDHDTGSGLDESAGDVHSDSACADHYDAASRQSEPVGRRRPRGPIV